MGRDQREQAWLDRFAARRDAPPKGWTRYLHAGQPKFVWWKRYSRYLKSHTWEQRRQGALKRAEGKCQLCPATTRLQVHHVTYDRVGCEQIEDLRVLCEPCHKEIHRNGKPFLPLDKATRAVSRQRREIRIAKKTELPKPKTKRRPQEPKPWPIEAPQPAPFIAPQSYRTLT
jgi:hypothetical protein